MRSSTPRDALSIVSSIGRDSMDTIRLLSTRISSGFSRVVSFLIRIRPLSGRSTGANPRGENHPMGVRIFKLASCGSAGAP